MARLINCDMEYFLKYVADKRIAAFGAGRKLTAFVEDYSLEEKIEFAIDNDPAKQGKECTIGEKSIKIESIQQLVQCDKANLIILITNTYSTAQMVEQLNVYEELDQIECFSASLMQDNCKAEKIVYTKGKQLIPKVIHYCWFGGNPISDKLLEYMESWEKYCSDYEIVRWDESNYDVNKNVYMSQAYQCGKWGFVSDYARLDIVGKHGGIYLDTDVELIKSLDDLLADRSFWGFGNYDSMNCGLGFGAVADNDLVFAMKDYYETRTFIKRDKTMDLRPCNYHQKSVLENYGFIMNNKQQKINGNVLYPMEVFNPTGYSGVYELYTKNTHSIHWTTMSWENSNNIQEWNAGRVILREFLKS